jgi:hypothetical protein
MQKKHSLRAFILASLFFSGSSFSQQVESYSLGLSEPTLSKIAESARTMVRTQKVLPNKLAIER